MLNKMCIKTTKILILSALTIISSCTNVKREPTIANRSNNDKAVIKFENPSFEDEPQPAHTPLGWDDCGFANETPPDIGPTEPFKVTQKAFHGKTYLGLVTRDIKTWEGVGQKLSKTIKEGSCYNLSIHIMRSPIYESVSQATRKNVNFI
jgi:hypothetical protein